MLVNVNLSARRLGWAPSEDNRPVGSPCATCLDWGRENDSYHFISRQPLTALNDLNTDHINI